VIADGVLEGPSHPTAIGFDSGQGVTYFRSSYFVPTLMYEVRLLLTTVSGAVERPHARGTGFVTTPAQMLRNLSALLLCFAWLDFAWLDFAWLDFAWLCVASLSCVLPSGAFHFSFVLLLIPLNHFAFLFIRALSKFDLRYYCKAT
jgi:hypothetical protein